MGFGHKDENGIGKSSAITVRPGLGSLVIAAAILTGNIEFVLPLAEKAVEAQ